MRVAARRAWMEVELLRYATRMRKPKTELLYDKIEMVKTRSRQKIHSKMTTMRVLNFLLVSLLMPLASSMTPINADTCTKESNSEECSASATLTSPTSSEIQSTRDQFNRDGYVVLKDFFDGSATKLLKEDWHEFSNLYWDRIFQALHSKGHISQPNHVMNDEYMSGKLRSPGYKEIVHRYPGRYELSLSEASLSSKEDEEIGDDKDDARSQLIHDMPSLQPIIDQLEPIVLSILEQHPNYSTTANDDKDGGKKYNLIHSMIISTPGSYSQKFHVDTTHINDEHWPSHIFNVFIPLVDITTSDLGPTEIIPKSHIESRILYSDKYTPSRKQQAHRNLKSPVGPLMNVGDVLMFDFRTMHRGLANIDERNINRPMLVLAFSLPNFQDKANWPGPSIFE